MGIIQSIATRKRRRTVSTLSSPLPKKSSASNLFLNYGKDVDGTSKRPRAVTVNDEFFKEQQIISYSSYGDQITEAYGNLNPTLIPIKQKVVIHLVPKFFAPEEKGFVKTYLLLVTLRQKIGSMVFLENEFGNFTATVEFHERKVVVNSNPQPSLKDRIRRSRAVSIRSVDAVVDTVKVIEGESLTISGIFLDKIGYIIDDDKFDLIVYPSTRVSSTPGKWLLMGTLYTKVPGCNKREQQWKAAVRPGFD